MFIDPIVTTHGTYSRARRTIHVNFMLVKLVVMDTHGTILVRNPTTTTFAFTTLPLDPRRKPLDVPRGYIIVVGIFAIPYV